VSTRPLLNGPIHAVPVDEPSEFEALQEQISDLEETLSTQASRIDAMEQFLQRIQHGLASIFSNAPVEPSAAPQAGRPGVWDSWKRKFPGKCADMIDALLEHGELSRFSLASLTAQNPRSGSYNQNIYKLNKHELIVKRGDKIALRAL
jgi:hypothetical protein